jgi:hypothetical protein
MFLRLAVVALALSSASVAFAATPAIGTVSTRGEIRVSGYPVKGTATLFENTAVETGVYAAVLRLDKGTEIKLGSQSSGTLFHDRLILSRGETELNVKTPFQLEANGFEVTPSAPNTSGIVAVGPQNTVEVAALQGELKVTNSRGALLANVTPGASLSFAADQDKPDSQAVAISDIGLESFKDGHYYLSSSKTGLSYEIIGSGLSKNVGAKIIINGKILQGTLDHPTLVKVDSSQVNGGDVGLSKKDKALLWLLAGAGAALGIGYATAGGASI